LSAAIEKGGYLLKARVSALNKEGETALAPRCILGVWGSWGELPSGSVWIDGSCRGREGAG